jgi:glycosyltransferase involved in cell wall biosynthesis
MFKNEADILESFIRYHSCIFDGIVLLDNGSTDNSVQIVRSLQNEGLPVYLEMDTTIEFTQGEKTTELLSYTINKFNPDMVFLLDLDEFVIAPNYPSNPREIINNLDKNEILYYIQRQHYHPLSSDNYEELFIPRRIKHVQMIQDESPKVIITKDIWEKYSPKIFMGNHDIAIDKTKVRKEILSSLKLAHFQYRSLEHVKSKFIVGWLNNLTRPNYIKGQSIHWKRAYDLIKENADISLEEIIGMPQCSEAPINLSFCDSIDIKYTSKNEVNFFENLLNYCEDLAKEYAKLRQEKNYLDEL